MNAPKKPSRGLALTLEEFDLLDRLRKAGGDGADAAELIEWLESEAVALYHNNNRLYNKISNLETRLALNIAAYPERFYAEMQTDNWHLLMRAAGVKVRKGVAPETMYAHFDVLPFSERGEALENYLCGCDKEGNRMLKPEETPA